MAAIDRSEDELDEGMEVEEGAEGKIHCCVNFGKLIRPGDTINSVKVVFASCKSNKFSNILLKRVCIYITDVKQMEPICRNLSHVGLNVEESRQIVFCSFAYIP